MGRRRRAVGSGVVEPDGSIAVEECLPLGIDAWVNCSRERPLVFENTLDEVIDIRSRRYGPDGDWITDGSSPFYPDETIAYLIERVIHDEWYKFWVTREYRPGEPQVRSTAALIRWLSRSRSKN